MHEAEPAPLRASLATVSYDKQPGTRDELIDQHGSIRAPWRRFIEHWNKLGSAELESRWETAQQLIHDNGVSYNVYGDPRGMERPWSLSLPPVIVGADEWTKLAQGISQRARHQQRSRKRSVATRPG